MNTIQQSKTSEGSSVNPFKEIIEDKVRNLRYLFQESNNNGGNLDGEQAH